MFDKQNAMLGNELLVCCILLPIAHVDLQQSLEPINERNDMVTAFKARIPCDAIDDVCSECLTLLAYEVNRDSPVAGRNLFSPDLACDEKSLSFLRDGSCRY